MLQTSLPPVLAPPENCPHCESELVRDGAWPFCPNFTCPRRNYGRLQKFVDVLDMKGCGEETLYALVEEFQIVKTPADLFDVTADEFCRIERKGLKHYNKFKAGLEVVKRMSVAEFFASLDCEGLGTWEAITVVPGLQSIDQILVAAQRRDLSHFDQALRVSEEKAQGICEDIERKMEAIGRLRGKVEIKEAGSRLIGKSFCITGSLSKPRREIEKRIKDVGGQVSSSVSSRTTHLVTNDVGSGSSKMKKAQSLGIPVISEPDLERMF